MANIVVEITSYHKAAGPPTNASCRSIDVNPLPLVAERFPFVCGGLGAMPTAAVGMFFPGKQLGARTWTA
jgi:hypothetical protein